MIKLYFAPRTRVVRMLWLLEELGPGPTLLGAELSAADIMLGFTLEAAKALGALSGRHPGALAYLTRLEERPGFQKALAT
jgi:glutathione S-transferase